MSKISKSNEYAVKYLSGEGKSPDLIAEELGLTVKKVESIVKTLGGTKPTNKKITKDLMINKTSAKNNNSVSIMTQEASQVGDEFIKKTVYEKRNTEGHIFRPKK